MWILIRMYSRKTDGFIRRVHIVKNSCRQLYLHLLHIHLLVSPVINDMDHSNIIYNIPPVIHIHTYSAASPYDDVKYPSVHSLKIPPVPYPHYCKFCLPLHNLLLIFLSFFHHNSPQLLHTRACFKKHSCKCFHVQ